MDIVVQGPLYYYTYPRIIELFKECDFVEKIIFSTWGDDIRLNDVDGMTMVETIDPVELGIDRGGGNRNRQIKSTREGLAHVTSDTCAKFRTDQVFKLETLYLLNDFYEQNKDGLKIMTLGMFRNWPFHPRDHVFWGPTERMNMLFDLPYDHQGDSADFDKIMRAECWIGCHYAAKYVPEMAEMLKDPPRYLLDNAPLKGEAFQIHNEWCHKLFIPSPQVSCDWLKWSLFNYQGNAGGSEYWS